jgi:hypothetical protein
MFPQQQENTAIMEERFCSEAGDSFGTQRKENINRWKPLSSNGNEDVTVDTRVCVIVNCKT